MKAKDVAQYALLIGAGFVAVKVAMKIKAGLDAGGKLADAAADAAKKLITEDLNPASDKNVVYSSLNKITSSALGRDTTVGGEIFEAVQWAKEKLGVKTSDTSDQSNTKMQAENMMEAKENFRELELAAERKAQQLADSQAIVMTRRREDFRLSEILADNYGPTEPTSFDKFLQTIAGQRK